MAAILGPYLTSEGDDEGIRLNIHPAVTLHLNTPIVQPLLKPTPH